ncbi:MAG: formyl transferase [Bacteroidota bacterium]
MKKPRIIFLASPCDFTNMIYHEIAEASDIYKVIFEKPVSKKVFVKRRIKRLGYLQVFGQLSFQLGIVPFLRKFSTKRIEEILSDKKISRNEIPHDKVIQVNSVNSKQTRQLLHELHPDLVLVNGTRIISEKTLASTDAPFVNLHVGITPLYRGVHGGYWALAKGNAACCGVTIHLIDKGIDTGGILAQSIIQPTKRDNFVTYPYLQVAAGIQLLNKLIRSFSSKKLQVLPPPKGPSRLWYHPTIWEYLGIYFQKGIK